MTPTTEVFMFAGGTFTGMATPQLQFRVTAKFRSSKTHMLYKGSSVADSIEEALEKAVFEALVSRATQFNKFHQDVGFRPVDELTSQLASVEKG